MRCRIHVNDLIEEAKDKGFVKIILEKGFDKSERHHLLERCLQREGILFGFEEEGAEGDYEINLNDIEIIYPQSKRVSYLKEFAPYLKEFTHLYISEALKFAEQEPSMEQFDKHIRRVISEKFGLLKNEVAILHHPFYWEFFLNNEDSPFEHVQKGGQNYVRLKRKRTEQDLLKLSNSILNKYENFFLARINTPPQQSLS